MFNVLQMIVTWPLMGLRSSQDKTTGGRWLGMAASCLGFCLVLVTVDRADSYSDLDFPVQCIYSFILKALCGSDLIGNNASMFLISIELYGKAWEIFNITLVVCKVSSLFFFS